jgi:REP element-mobilizing transposase RayT
MTFSTKDRVRAIAYPEVRAALNEYAGGILRNLKCPSVVVGSVIDHMHLLYLQARTVPTCDVAEAVKKETSRWLKEQKPDVKDPYLVKFAWQSGYAAFSVSESNVEAVRAYIASQEEHHKRVTFQDEYRAFLMKHGVEFDERYVWD